MTTSTVALALAVFGASAVEMVEALTIVIAAGATRGWRSAMEGATTAIVVLTVLVAAVGIPLVRYVPIDALRVIVGGLLLVLGLSWLRKAILRASGHKALHDEDAIYARTVAELRRDHDRAPAPKLRDAVGFMVAFKGVLLEGTEVVLIVISLGSSQNQLGLAAIAAAAAVLLVGGIGALVARQLSEVPENALKTGVGIMLSSFGVFWVGEGAGVHWPGNDLFILALIGLFVLVTAGAVISLRPSAPSVRATTSAPTSVEDLVNKSPVAESAQR